MRRLRVSLRPEAMDDLREIEALIAELSGSDPLAARYVRRLRTSLKRIGDAPWAGTPREDLWPGMRTSSFERRALIAYLIEGDRVRVARVFWGGQDVEGYYRRRWAADGD